MTDREPTRAECLQRLELEETASPEEIRHAYRSLALRLHPDQHPDDASGNHRFVEITEAYAALKRMGCLTVAAADNSPRVMPHEMWTHATLHIQSGTTAWWRNRHWMCLVVLLTFAGWFAYNGYIRYPARYRQWATEAIGDPTADISPNSRVEWSTLKLIVAELVGRSVTFPEFVALHEKYLGKAGYQQGQEYGWVGRTMYIRLDPTITPDQDAGRIPGRQRLQWREISLAPGDSGEGRIHSQRRFAFILLGVAALVGLRLIRVMTTRISLDDNGLRYNRRFIPWEAISGLRSKDYDRKHWVDLEYTAGNGMRSFRLDRFHIDKFNEMLRAICERKGFASPLPAAKS